MNFMFSNFSAIKNFEDGFTTVLLARFRAIIFGKREPKGCCCATEGLSGHGCEVGRAAGKPRLLR